LRSGAVLFTTLPSFRVVQQYGLRTFPEIKSLNNSANTINREINKELQGVSRFIFKKRKEKIGRPPQNDRSMAIVILRERSDRRI
jgi:hypothetical protein